MMTPGRAGGALASLTAAALALPAFQAQADAREETRSVSVRASQYAEGDIPKDKTSGGETSRYDISTFSLRATTPVAADYRVTADLGYETMSGASPWFVQPDADGRPVQVMSGATIDENRLDGSVDLRRYGDSSEQALTLGYSTENDYSSANVGGEILYALGSQVSLNLGAGYSADKIEPTDGGSEQYPSRAVSENRHSINGVAGLTGILSATTVLQTALSYTVNSGYLSDPYKLASVEGAAVPDSRPDDRTQFAWTTRLRQRLGDLGASLHLDYRYYHDSWQLESHTLELAWYQEIGETWWVVPSVRYYSQTQANFYRPYYVSSREDGNYSSDYRLSPYGAISASLMLRRSFGSQAVSLSVQYYDSGGEYALGKVDVENPGLVDFWMATLGYDFSI